MARYRKYKTDQALRRAIERYFQSISRDAPVMEAFSTGKKDKWGHLIMDQRPVVNGLGEEMRRREFLSPPTAGGLCAYLGISRDTWARYCDSSENPQFQETTAWARETLQAYLEEQLLTREGRNIQGVVFTLQNGYGMSGKTAADLGPGAAAKECVPLSQREDILREIAREFGDGGP